MFSKKSDLGSRVLMSWGLGLILTLVIGILYFLLFKTIYEQETKVNKNLEVKSYIPGQVYVIGNASNVSYAVLGFREDGVVVWKNIPMDGKSQVSYESIQE